MFSANQPEQYQPHPFRLIWQVAALFKAIKAAAPKLQTLRASKVGIPPETAMPEFVELCAPGSALRCVTDGLYS